MHHFLAAGPFFLIKWVHVVIKLTAKKYKAYRSISLADCV